MSARKVNFQLGQRKEGVAPSKMTPTLESHRVEANDIDNGANREDMTLYPLRDLLQEIIHQEKQTWNKNHGIHIPIEDGGSQLGIDEEVLSIGGGSVPSVLSHGSQFTTDPSTMYLIRYGQLTNVIHRYFKKLEKEHSCLYLSGRRANFENLRLHPDRVTPSPLPPEEDNSTYFRRREIHSLRDEELLVYRCALMCAQFPMLSAPSPPDDRSPSPPMPPLTMLSQTAPSESSVVMATLSSTTLREQITQPHQQQLSTRQNNETTHITDEASTIPDTSTDTIPFTMDPVATTNTLTLGDSNPGILTNALKEPEEVEEPEEAVHSKLKQNKTPSHERRKSRKGSIGDQRDDRKETSKRAGLRRYQNSGTNEDSDYESDEVSRLSQNKRPICLDPLRRDQPFPPMVNRDMLCALVRRAFHQTEEQQIQFEQILRHEYGRKSKGEILARELVAQLQILENNAHSFYKPGNFVTRNGYDIWLQSEKLRVRQQLDKFWHFQLPKLQTLPQFIPPDYHKAYITLLEKIICSESRSSRREPVRGGRTPSSPLNATAERLLTEFGLRYGVGELFRRLIYLDYLAKHFDYEVWYIRHCTEELRAIRGLIPHNRAKMTATRREMDILRNTVHLLHGQADNSLTRIDRLFQGSDPQLGVASLIDLLKEVLDAEQTLFGQKSRPLDAWLKRYLKNGFVLRYERRKEIVAVEVFSTRNIAPFFLTPVLINALLLAIREEISNYRVYQTVFRRYFNIVPLAKVEFYQLLCADACSLCARAIHDPVSRQRLNLEMLGLLYRLNDRDIEWSNVIPTEMQQWRNEFVHLALVWMDVLAKQINQWVLLAIREDQWTVLTFAGATHSRSPSIDDRSSTNSLTILPNNVHISPFPSTISNSPMSLHSTLTHHTQSAFTPVKQPGYNRETLSPMSEASGGISEITSSHTSFGSLENSTTTLPLPTKKSNKKLNNVPTNTLINFGKGGGANLTDSTLVPDVHSPSPLSDNKDYTPNNSPPPILSTLELDRKKEAESTREDGVVNNGVVIAAEVYQGDDIEEPLSPQKRLSPAAKVESLVVVENGFQSPHSSPINIPTPTGDYVPSPRRSHAPLPRDQALEEDDEEGSDEVLPKFPDPPVLNFTTKPSKLPSKPPQISLVPNLSSIHGTTTSTSIKVPRQTPMGGAKPLEPVQTSVYSDIDDISSSPAVLPISPTPSTDAVCYFLPLSNSPVDLVSMYIRLASFVGNLLHVLTPKIRQGFQPPGLDGSVEVPTEVAQIRRLMTSIQQQAESMRIEFLKKIHKTMVNSLKLYGDNLLCMDLCCWPQGEAIGLLGEEMIHHLQRRRDTDEIWGCRHIVEANHGMHHNGIPCLKNVHSLFESITRDMCLRINNIHMIISIFPLLESHIYTTTLSPSSHTPFGSTAISSEASSGVQLGTDQPQAKTQRPFPHRYRPEVRKQQPLELLPQKACNGQSESDTGPSGLGVTPLSRRKLESGFQSTEANQLLEYLQNIQDCQLQMICVRMNRFFKPALTLLLKLKLGDCPISRRLDPIVTFLIRHCKALKQHLYPDCFQILIQILWKLILQDIEEEALKLRTMKKYVVSHAHLLLQTITYFIKIIHDEGQGLSLEILTSSTEYLLALLDVFIQPTERVIKAFAKLSGPHFTQTYVQLDQSPVPLTSQIIHDLSLKLHTYRKCFTGEEFVTGLIQLGEDLDSETSEQRDLRPNETPSDRVITYTVTSSIQLGQYLLEEGILICLLDYANSRTNTPLESSSPERINALNTSRHNTVNEERSITPHLSSNENRSDSHHSFYSTESSSPPTPNPQPPQFKNKPNCWYRFADLEDSVTGSFFHRAQILSMSNHRISSQQRRSPDGLQLSEFDQARFGTLFLMLDVLQQRASKDKRAKQFLQRPNVIMVAQQRTGNDISCFKIFRI